MRSLGDVGIWSRQLRFGDPAAALEAAAELDDLGYGALWIPDIGGPVLDTVARLLAATRRVVVATGVLNVWMHDPQEVAAGQAMLDDLHPGRFLLGLGVGHPTVVDAGEPGRYRQPLEKMRAYLELLDSFIPSEPRPSRILAALGPRMTELAGERTLGVHPFLVPVTHTFDVRDALPPERLVATALSVVVESDLLRSRAIARRDLAAFLELPNYTNTWRRLGFTDADLARGGSDRLVDALYAQGSTERIFERVVEHQEAGADHVCLRVVSDHPGDAHRLPREEWRALADVVIG
jgi:probable F420-dependent oxidoreductase